jgi:hypothetical protein
MPVHIKNENVERNVKSFVIVLDEANLIYVVVRVPAGILRTENVSREHGDGARDLGEIAERLHVVVAMSEEVPILVGRFRHTVKIAVRNASSRHSVEATTLLLTVLLVSVTRITIHTVFVGNIARVSGLVDKPRPCGVGVPLSSLAVIIHSPSVAGDNTKGAVVLVDVLGIHSWTI